MDGWHSPPAASVAHDPAETVRNAVESAVRRQLMADVPVGVLLSGGLDSSIVLAVARRHYPGKLHTFSIGYSALDSRSQAAGYNDDLRYARLMAGEHGTEHHEIVVDATEAVSDMLHVMWPLDEPMVEPVFISSYLLCRAAHEAGVPVILTGDGADELFGGYARYFAAERLARLDHVPGARTLARAAALMVPRGQLGDNLANLARLIGRPRLEQYQRYCTNYEPDEALALIRPEVRELVDTSAGEEVLGRALPAGPLAPAMARGDLVLWIGEHFNPRLDRMSMQHSIEVRVPFKDEEVVAAAAAIPWSRRTRPGMPKAVLKEAIRDLLPPDVMSRPKRYFQAPRDAWLRAAGPLLQDALGECHESNSPLLAPDSHKGFESSRLKAWPGAIGAGPLPWRLCGRLT
jgi:asparagine synthase (glutamine-hydrolysing)